ncbi:coiled-coil domain-containing protein 9B isoform X2 [Tiliqua scincoides]|uniref:coiled-coil domain-containing protein 9B isoform X2 n=1 Tax=Tiliqua scincoides TaxID=71010 RepID=UPI003462DF5B
MLQSVLDAAAEDAVLRKKEQKDVELDKKIIALRKKNEALMRRYQEIEEDRKRAEQEGMAVTSRRARPDGLTITITKAHNEKRIVSEKWGSICSPAGIGSEEEEDDEESDHLFTFRMGKRVQLAVTMDNKAKGKRVVSEKRGSECLGNPGEAPDVSEEEMDQLVAFRRGRRMQIAITMDKADEKRTVEKRRSEGDKHSEVKKERGKSPQKSAGDKSCTLTGRERSEYMRWKKERDQIDLERLARHKNARGEWRRAWDVEKSERMFEDSKDGEPTLDCPPSKKGGRNARKSQHRSLPLEEKGGPHRTSSTESASRTLPVVSSKARGKDRLTGRARRWDSKEGEEVPFVKDETDRQTSTSTEQLKGRILVSEVLKEQSSPKGLEKTAEPQDSQECSVFVPPAGKGPSAGEDQSTKEKTRRCLIQEVPTLSTDEPGADLKLNKTIFGADLSPKGNCIPSSYQGVVGSTVQAAGCDLKETNSTLLSDGLDKSAHSERVPNEDCAENPSELLIKTKTGDGSQGLSTAGQGEVEILKRPKIHVKESDATAQLVHRDKSRSLSKETPDRVNVSAQEEEAAMRNKKQEQPETYSRAQEVRTH